MGNPQSGFSLSIYTVPDLYHPFNKISRSYTAKLFSGPAGTTFAPRFRSRLSRFIGDLSGPVGAVSNRTALEYLINPKVQ